MYNTIKVEILNQFFEDTGTHISVLINVYFSKYRTNGKIN